jgi:hypothetical protein
MKTPIRLLLAVAVCATAVSSHAQSPAPSAPPTPEATAKPERERWGGRHDRMTEGLPEDVRTRFRELREEALRDPEIAELRGKAEAAWKDFRDSMRAVMQERDPELAETVRAHFDKRWGQYGRRGQEAKKSESAAATPTPIPADKRDRIERAREIARQAPAVQSARAAMQAAQSPEARREAGREFQEAMRAAMLTADPSLIDVIDSLPRKRGGGAPEGKPE